MIKKQTFLIFTFLIFTSLRIYSCECVEFSTFVKSFENSQFIAEITILDTYVNEIKKEKYAQIKINKLYKGKRINRIKFGSSEYISSCDTRVEKGMRLIVYLKEYNNEFSISTCNRIIHPNNIENEKKILKKAAENNENYINGITLLTEEPLQYFYIMNAEEKFKFENRNAIYEVLLNFNNQVLNIKPIIGFSNYNLNEEIILNLKSIKWEKEKHSLENTKHLIEVSHFMKTNNSTKQKLFYKNRFLVTEY